MAASWITDFESSMVGCEAPEEEDGDSGGAAAVNEAGEVMETMESRGGGESSAGGEARRLKLIEARDARRKKRGDAPQPDLSKLTSKDVEVLWRVFDYNGNGLLSLAEMKRAIRELWPKVDRTPALLRALRASDASGNGLVERNEFNRLLKNVAYFDKLETAFDQIDTDNDRRINLKEFIKGAELIGYVAPSWLLLLRRPG